MIVFPSIVALILILPAMFERKLYKNPQQGVLTYTGWGLNKGTGLFGINPIRIDGLEFDDGAWTADLRKVIRPGAAELADDELGYAVAHGRFPNGEHRFEAIVKVVKDWSGYRVDLDSIWEGKFYLPSGELVSEVRDGTGTQIIAYQNGKLAWKQELRGGKTERLKRWYENGSILLDFAYDRGLKNGDSFTYYENGQMKSHSVYQSGKPAGTWSYWEKTGNLTRQESHPDTSRD